MAANTRQSEHADPAMRALKAQELVREGLSKSEVARRLGISRTTVARDLQLVRERQTRSGKAPARKPKLSKRAPVVKKTQTGGLFQSPLTAIIPPSHINEHWDKLDLSSETFERMGPGKLFDVLRSASPDVSRAVWDALRLLDPGHEIDAFYPGTDRPYEAAKAKLNEFIDLLSDRYGSMKVINGRLFMSGLTRGAFLAELVLDEQGRTPIDISLPDPYSVAFRLVQDEELGERYELVQWQGGKGYVSIERPTVRYIPLDPAVGSPYGVSPIAPAVFPALFLIGLLGDVRRVIAQAGYPKTDLTVKLEGIKAMFPEDADFNEIREALGGVIDDIAKDYSEVQPEEAYVHTDAVEVGQAKGAVSDNSLRGIDSVIAALERMLIKALKTMPLMMGDAQGTSEANANRQWEVYAAGIKSLQHLAESLLGYLLTLSLEVQGIAADVKVTFAELRASEELRDEQTLTLKLANAEKMEALGYADRDEASMHAVGHPAAVKKRAPAPPPAPEPQEATDEPGEQTPAGEQPEPLDAGEEKGRKPAEPEQREVEPFVPEAPGNLPDLPDRFVPDADILSDATVIWAAAHEAPHDTLLDALLLADDEHEGGVTIEQAKVAGADWVYDRSANEYIDVATNDRLEQKALADLAAPVVDYQVDRIDALTDALTAGDMTVRSFDREFRDRVTRGVLAGYMAGRGGINMMDDAARAAAGEEALIQQEFARGYVEKVIAGELTPNQIKARARLYPASTRANLFKGIAGAFGIRLEQWPGSGHTECLGACQCHLTFEQRETTVDVTWHLGPAEGHCVDCPDLARRWNPLVVEKEAE